MASWLLGVVMWGSEKWGDRFRREVGVRMMRKSLALISVFGDLLNHKSELNFQMFWLALLDKLGVSSFEAIKLFSLAQLTLLARNVQQ